MTQDKNASGAQSGKPEWFQLIDSDAPSAQVTKVNKKLPVIALIVTGVIAASGTFFANATDTNQSSINPAPSASANAVSDVVDANAATPQANTTDSKSTKIVNVTTSTAPAGKVQNPNQTGVPAPSAGRDDDEDEDHWGWLPGRDHDDDDDDDDEHEDREGHEREKRH
jgi:hypothetical protein